MKGVVDRGGISLPLHVNYNHPNGDRIRRYNEEVIPSFVYHII